MKKELISTILLCSMASYCFAGPASLDFVSGTSSMICPGVPSMPNFSAGLWFKPRTIAVSNRLISRLNSSGLVNAFSLAGATGAELQASYRTAVTATYTTNNLFLSTGRWYYGAFTLRTNNTTSRATICAGSTTISCNERTYGTATDGSGVFNSESAHFLYIGSREGLTQGHDGQVAGWWVSSGPLTDLVSYAQDKQYEISPSTNTGIWLVSTSSGLSDGTIRIHDITGTYGDCFGSGVTESSEGPAITWAGGEH